MICICHKQQFVLLSSFQNLSANVGTNLVVPPDLMSSVNSLSSAQSAASAALAAAPAGGTDAAASAQLAAAAALSASPQLSAATQLSALAAGAGSMKSGLGIDMNSPSAGEACGELWTKLPGLMKTLAGLPAFLQPKLSELAKAGELVDKLKNEFGVDLESPDWADALSDAVADKISEAKKKAEDAASQAASAADSASGAVQVSAAPSLSAEQSASQTSDVIAATLVSVQSGLGVDLAAPGGMDALAKKLSSVKGSVSAMPAEMDPLDMGLIQSTMQMLSSISALRRTLGIDVLASGAGGSLQSQLNSLASNLGSSADGAAALESAASFSPGGDASGSASGEGSASLDSSTSASASLSMDASAASDMSLAADASAAALAGSPLANPALAQMMAGMPGMPIPWLLLTSLSAQVKSTLGIQLIAHAPCE